MKKIQTKRGVSLIRMLLIICIIIAVLIFFNAMSLDEIKKLFLDLGQGVVSLLKVLWGQIIMPVVNFFLVILGRVVHR